MKERIERGLTALGIDAPGGAAALAEYGRLLLEQNQVMNLTAITAPDQVADLHFLDCAALLNAPGISFAGKSLIDVGTGAGFPGLPLRILEPTIRLTLLDSLGKRVSWLEQAGRCVSRLGGRLHKSWDYEIPGAGVAHRLVIVEKISSTPKGYPRRWAKIQKAPL